MKATQQAINSLTIHGQVVNEKYIINDNPTGYKIIGTIWGKNKKELQKEIEGEYPDSKGLSFWYFTTPTWFNDGVLHHVRIMVSI